MAFNNWTEKTRLDISSGTARYTSITAGTPTVTITVDVESQIRFTTAIGTTAGDNSLKIPASIPVEIVVPWGIKTASASTVYLHVKPTSSESTKYAYIVEH